MRKERNMKAFNGEKFERIGNAEKEINKKKKVCFKLDQKMNCTRHRKRNEKQRDGYERTHLSKIGLKKKQK